MESALPSFGRHQFVHAVPMQRQGIEPETFEPWLAVHWPEGSGTRALFAKVRRFFAACEGRACERCGGLADSDTDKWNRVQSVVKQY